MTKQILYASLAHVLFIALLFVGCNNNDAIPPHIQLKSPTPLLTEAEGGEFTIQFHSPKDWQASSDQSWCTLLSSTGMAGEGSLVVRVEENLTTTPREAFVTLSAEGMSQMVQVSQSTYAQVSFVRITHASNRFPLPLLMGESPSATIHWGDGQKDTYTTDSLVHEYAHKQEYHLTMVVWGSDKVEIPTLKDVSEIDFSDF